MLIVSGWDTYINLVEYLAVIRRLCYMFSLIVWLFLLLLCVISFLQKNGVDATTVKEEENFFDYDEYNPLGHEYESGEDGVEQVKCADEFVDEGTNE